MPTEIDLLRKNISESGKSIYDEIHPKDSRLWIPSNVLETILKEKLVGLSVANMPIRSRSKAVKQEVCLAMGYPIPDKFRRCRPRFPGQNFDVYVQKNNNLQIWNEEINVSRRYVILQVDSCGIIGKIKIVDGGRLSELTKGTLTQKYQARLSVAKLKSELYTPIDTENLRIILTNNTRIELIDCDPSSDPSADYLLSIKDIYDRLISIIGHNFDDPGPDQERNRGGLLHKLICKKLGYENFRDNGQFPDVKHQLLEIKLQTSPTIDLGLISPDSQQPLPIPDLKSHLIMHKDVRYAVFYGEKKDGKIKISSLILTTGEAFYSKFKKFQGRGINKKIQIPLPKNFFS